MKDCQSMRRIKLAVSRQFRCACFAIKPSNLCVFAFVVVGLVTSGGFGYRLKRSIALAYVRTDLALAGTELEVEILGSRRRAVVAREPLYDPNNMRLRG
jgi:glycine cleavage system aminomethyltransferase T